MFEQSMLLPSAPGKKAGALAVSLAAQTFVVGTLLVIPLLYTDRLPLAQFQLPTFLPPAPPPEPMKPEPAPRHRPRILRELVVPASIPPLNTQPEIIDDAPAAPASIDTGVFVPPSLNTIINRVIPPPPPPPLHLTEVAPSKPVTVTSEIQAAKLIKKVQPVYPRLAIIARTSGTVRLTGIIGKDGLIQQLQVIDGPPLLVQAAVDAVRQWVYKPTLLGNKPVEVVAPIIVTFTLTQ
jgi:protein TonB